MLRCLNNKAKKPFFAQYFFVQLKFFFEYAKMMERLYLAPHAKSQEKREILNPDHVEAIGRFVFVA